MKISSQIWKLLFTTVFIFAGIILQFNKATAFLGLGCILFALVIISYLVLRILSCRYRRSSRFLAMILTIFLSIGFVAAVITGVLVGISATGDSKKELEYVVVLGAKVNGKVPSRTLGERIDAAAVYLRENPNTIAVVSGGQGSDEGISEAQCIYNGLVQRGVEAERIWLEDQATSTRENVEFSLKLIAEKTGSRPTEIGLISSEFHLYRGGLLAKECGVRAYGIPAKTTNPLYFLNYYLREIVGVWHYIVFRN